MLHVEQAMSSGGFVRADPSRVVRFLLSALDANWISAPMSCRTPPAPSARTPYRRHPPRRIRYPIPLDTPLCGRRVR